MTVSIVASFDLRQQDFTPRFLGMKFARAFLAETDKKGKHYGFRVRRKAVPVHIPLKTFATADVTMVVIIRNILFTTFWFSSSLHLSQPTWPRPFHHSSPT